MQRNVIAVWWMSSLWLWIVPLLGCSEGASDASSITYARVLGVRVEVESDPERSTPAIGEAVTARVLVSGPEGATEVSYAMDVCAALPETGGLPACAGPSLAVVTSDTATTEPTLTWAGLTTEQVGDADALLVRGTICEQGRPAPDVTRPGQCVEPSFVGVSFVHRVTLLHDQQAPNHHPTLSNAVVRFDDAEWAAGECEASIPRDGEEHTLSITLTDAHRETVDDENETLLLSWFTNVGALDQHFSVLEPEQAQDEPLTVTWTAPQADDNNPQGIATITLVLRDQRGGIDWITRTVCFDS